MSNYTKFTDAQLITKYLKGHNQAFDALVARYKSLVYTIPMRFGMSEDEANDVFQSVWFSLLKKLPTLRQRDRLKAWLVTTARRECSSRRRGARYEREETTDPHKFPADKPVFGSAPTQSPEGKLIAKDEQYEQYEKQMRIRQAVKQLGGRCERLLNYLYYSDSKSSYAEIAGELGMSVGSVGPTRGRCLKKLKQLLTKQEKSTNQVSNTHPLPL